GLAGRSEVMQGPLGSTQHRCRVKAFSKARDAGLRRAATLYGSMLQMQLGVLPSRDHLRLLRLRRWWQGAAMALGGHGGSPCAAMARSFPCGTTDTTRRGRAASAASRT